MIESRNSRMNESVLDVLTLRNRVISNNIANVDTPGFKSQSVVFQDELRRQLGRDNENTLPLRKTHPKHLPLHRSSAGVPYQVIHNEDTIQNNNGNNVDIDKEMAELAKNQLAYNVIVDRVSGHYSKLKKLITDLR